MKIYSYLAIFCMTPIMLLAGLPSSWAQQGVDIQQLYQDRQRLLIQAQICTQDIDCTVMYNQRFEDGKCYTPINRHNNIDELMSVTADFKRVDPRRKSCPPPKNIRAFCQVNRCFIRPKFDGESNYVEEQTSKLNYNNQGILLKDVTYDASNYFGKTTVYYPNGFKQTETNYFKNQKHGEEKQFSKAGKLLNLKTYAHGQRNGLHQNYHGNGHIQAEFMYENGMMITEKIYDNRGKLKKDYRIIEGQECTRRFDYNGKEFSRTPGCSFD